MPKRTDITSILVIGAGPIVIGQACEFDYSGTQAIKALKAEGYRVILVNSNPATIMTDPELADATYIEPITPEVVTKIIAKERPDACLPTMGGQTALNMARTLAEDGTFERYGVRLIGASREAIAKAEDRELFRDAMARIGLEMPKSVVARTPAEAAAALEAVGLPAIIRPSYTLGGWGGGVAYNREEFDQVVAAGLDASPIGEILVEESVLGWKEYEMEVVRDRADNCIIVCSIENVDPMGVHTGDSITVAPALTLTDKEYQRMRNASIAVLREIGVDTGGSNVQFAVNPEDGRMVIIEMNPRVSRSSALASKATGFPIAKVAARLAVGYTLDEITNDITGCTPASFEPTIDYVVTKVPRFTFEKFPETEPILTTSMKSVGEVMALGRTFAESLQKALRSLETGLEGLDEVEIGGPADPERPRDALRAALARPTPDRLRVIAQAFRAGLGVDEIHSACRYDPWFLQQIEALVATEERVRAAGPPRGRAGVARAQGDGLLGCPPRHARRAQRSRRRRAAARAGRPSGVQARRHLRRRVRGAHALSLQLLRDRARRCRRRCRGRVRGLAQRAPQGDHPGQRAEPDRAGHRVRLLLRPCGVRPRRGRLRDDHGELQSGDRLDRLRHLGPAVLRAAHGRGRARDRARRGERGRASGRDRAARRPDAAQARQAARRRRRPDPRHLARRDRPRRGSRALSAAPAAARPAPARQRDLHRPQGRAAQGRAHRLPDRAAAVLRARRPGDADRPQRRRGRAVHEPGGHARQARADPDRPLSAGCDRGRRRRGRGRRAGVRRRGHGAHRGGRHPLRRQRLLAAAVLAAGGGPGRDPPPGRGPGARPRGARPDERADGDQGRRGVHPRGQPARLAHGAVRRQGDRPADRQDRRAGHGGREPARLRAERAPAAACRGQGGGVPVRALSGRRFAARPGDEVDRRGHGAGPRFRRRLRQIPARGRQSAARSGARCSSRCAIATSPRWWRSAGSCWRAAIS